MSRELTSRHMGDLLGSAAIFLGIIAFFLIHSFEAPTYPRYKRKRRPRRQRRGGRW